MNPQGLAPKSTRQAVARLSAAVALLSLLAAFGSVAPTRAAVTRTEAEAIPDPPACWQTLDWAALSGGRGRTCWAANAPLSWTVSVASGQTAGLRLYGYRDDLLRGFRVRIDGGPWSSGSITGTSAPSALFWVSPVLNPGTHRVELESTSLNSFSFDYFEVDTGSATTPPPATTLPPATTPPADGICKIDPRDGQAAITAAIAACPNNTTVSFPANHTYHQTSYIRVERRSGLVIDGNGSTFIKTNSGDGLQARPNWQMLEDTNVTLQNMTVRGSLPPGPRGITPGNQFDHGVMIYGGDGITVRDVTVRDVFGDFVSTAPSGFIRGGGALGGQVPRNVVVRRLKGQSAARMCLGLTAGIGIRVEDSVLEDCRYSGIDLETDAPGEPLRDVHILRNTISGYYLFAIGVAGPWDAPPHVGDVSDIEIRGNVTTTPSDACWATVNVARGPIANVVVEDNDLKTISDGVQLTGVSSGSVKANKIQISVNLAWCGPPRSMPVRLIDSPFVVASGNNALGF